MTHNIANHALIHDAVRRAGVKPEMHDRACRYVRLLTGDDESMIDDAVTTLRHALPAMFEPPVVAGGQGRDIDGLGLVECAVWFAAFFAVVAVIALIGGAL